MFATDEQYSHLPAWLAKLVRCMGSGGVQSIPAKELTFCIDDSLAAFGVVRLLPLGMLPSPPV